MREGEIAADEVESESEVRDGEADSEPSFEERQTQHEIDLPESQYRIQRKRKRPRGLESFIDY